MEDGFIPRINLSQLFILEINQGIEAEILNQINPKILTIGGSTTDNLFVTEGETWQDILDTKFPKYDFINGGVHGQSSFGHKISIAKWHSKSLNPESVEFIIFYIGINYVHLLRGELNDYVHTNKNGSKKIAEYIEKIKTLN